MSHIKTATGRYIDFLHPMENEYDIQDIAHALSMQCRFTGHTSRHYSVAQHSVLVSYQVPSDFAFAGLMHDAVEAYLGDVSSPLKALLPEYKKIEHAMERALFLQHGVEFPFPPCIKQADLIALNVERLELFDPARRDPDYWPAPPAMKVRPTSPFVAAIRMTPEEAKQVFLLRYRALTRR